MAEPSVSVVSNNINTQNQNDSALRSDPGHIEVTQKGTEIFHSAMHVDRYSPFTPFDSCYFALKF